MKFIQLRFLSVKTLVVIAISVALSFALSGQLQAQSSQIQGPRDNAQVYSGVVYGPIDQNDTLWRIASRYKQDARFTVYQTMLAIYELNTQAFENGNFNTMVNGATLRLPSDRYIARTDPQKARAKAEQDDRLFGRQNSIQSSGTTANPATGNAADSSNAASANLKPEIPLVNQEDLSKTQSQLQTQLNNLRSQQQQQFEALKDQVAASITSVEILLDENKKLNERLLQIDENNRNLTQTVETELQVQIDQQVAQLNQLIDLVKNAEQRRIDEESKSILTLLTSNTAIILISSAITLIVLVFLFIFLLRRSGPANSSVPATKKSEDIIDDELVIGELDDEIDQDSDDLLAALEQDTASQEDDILSDELEEDDAISALNEDDLGADFDIEEEISSPDDFGDVDDMLVPDSLEGEDVTAIDDEAGAIGGEDELDFDAISLDEEETEEAASSDIDQIDLTDDAGSILNEDLDIDNTENPFAEDVEEQAPEGLKLDENGDIDEDTLDQIEQTIEEKDKTINSLADELLDELDAELADDKTGNSEDGSITAASNEEVDATTTEDTTEQDESEQATDDIDIDSILDEVSDSVDSDINESDLEDELSGLSDELIADLEEESQAQNDLDELLDQDDMLALDDDVSSDGTKENSQAENEQLQDSIADNETDISDFETPIDMSALDEDIANEIDASDDQVNALADELLQELESENREPDELDSMLNELDEDVSVDDDTQNSVDADDLLDDIPSFTSAIVDEDLVDSDTKNDVASDIESDEKGKTESKINENASNKPPTDDLESAPTSDSAENDDFEEEQDLLSSLPDLDDWLDEDDPDLSDESASNEPEPPKKNKSYLNDEELGTNFDDELESDFDLSALELDDVETGFENAENETEEDDLIKGLDDASFDDMLNDLASDMDLETNDTALSTDSTTDDELALAGLDIEALMTEDDKRGDPDVDKVLDSGDLDDAFLDVDDLLQESDAMPQMQDSDLDLDLESSLDQLVKSNDFGNENALDEISDDENDQASNLDLAQVYIDMEDIEAAQELLDEVKRKGTPQQIKEANALLASFVD